MHRFYITPEEIKRDTIILKSPEAKHAFLVLRLRRNEEVVVFDGKGKEYIGRIKSLSVKQGTVLITKTLQHKPEEVKITLAAAIPKQSKFDAIIDKATQLGVDTIIPLITERTIIKIDSDKARLKIKRWQKIAQEAAKQCGCVFVPKVAPVIDFQSQLKKAAYYSLALIPSLHEETVSIKKILQNNKFYDIIVFIGPEGDFTVEEIEAAKKSGCIGISLGKNVLRCEIAVTMVLSVLNYEWKS